MKQDHFHEGLNPEYRQMLAHKVDGQIPAGYSDLLLAMRSWKEGQRLETHCPQRHLWPVCQMWHVLRPQGTVTPHASWKVVVLSPLQLQLLAAMRLMKTLVQSRNGIGRQNLQLAKRPKHQVEWGEQINLWSILFALARQLNYTNRKTTVVLGVEVLAISCRIAQKTLAKQHEKWL